MLRYGELLAARFEALGDEEEVVRERRILWKRIGGWPGPPDEERQRQEHDER